MAQYCSMNQLAELMKKGWPKRIEDRPLSTARCEGIVCGI